MIDGRLVMALHFALLTGRARAYPSRDVTSHAVPNEAVAHQTLSSANAQLSQPVEKIKDLASRVWWYDRSGVASGDIPEEHQTAWEGRNVPQGEAGNGGAVSMYDCRVVLLEGKVTEVDAERHRADWGMEQGIGDEVARGR